MSNRHFALLKSCFLALFLAPCSVPEVSYAEEPQNTLKTSAYKHGIVGINFIVRAQRLPKIALVYPDTPAQAAGLRTGDQIATIDGLATENLTMPDIFDRLTGKPGTTVDIGITRGQETFTVTLKRAKLATLNAKHPDLVRGYLQSPTQ